MSEIRFCEQCGHLLTEGARFCQDCGAPVGRSSNPQVPLKKKTHEEAPSSAISQRHSSDDRSAHGDAAVFTPRKPNHRPVQNERRPVPQGNPEENRRRSAPQGNPEENRRRPAAQGNPEENRRRPTPQRNQEEYERRQRYRQEELENDWEQSWQRRPVEEEDEQGFTPVQYVLIGLMILLLIALIGFGVFWVFGRSDKKNDSDRSSGVGQEVQTESVEQEENAIEILDGNGQVVTTQTPETNTESEAAASETAAPAQTEAVADMVLNYPEFSVTIPGSWKGKYGITQSSDSYTYYHQGSKAKGAGGEFFTVTCYKDSSYKDLPDQMLIGLGNGTAYVCTTPTYVPYPPDDEAAAEEYRQMSADLGEPTDRIKMLVSGAGPKETEPAPVIEIQSQEQVQTQPRQQEASAGGYISYSSQELLDDSDVAGMSYDDLQMAINEIYARHGRRFASESIQSYFDSQPWYSGTVEPENFSDSVFSSTEAQNIQFLLKKMGIQ